MSRKIEVQILGDSKQLEAALGRAQQKTSRFGSALAAGAKVGAAGLLGLGVAAKIGFDELVDSQKVMKQTQAVIKSTGGEANVTAEHVDTLSQSLLQLSGVDDETIASGENMLLTFRNIHNEVGKGNDIFDQATKATLDLSVAMGKDMQSSAILVGKALNDPIKGMTALRRVGVSLSDDQEKLVTHLVNTGKTMQAQKIILAELTKEFGGSAAAAGTTLPAQLSKLRESFADVAAQLVSALLPATNQLIGVLTRATQWMKQNEQATKVLVIAFAGLSTALVAAKVAYALANSSLVTLIRSERVARIVTGAFATAQWALNAALLANPVGAVIAAVIALGVALVIAYKKSQTFRNVVGGVIDFVREHWKSLVALIPGIGPALFLVVRYFDNIKNAVFGVIGAVDSLLGKISSVKSAVSTSGIDVVKGLFNTNTKQPYQVGTGGFGFGINKGPQGRPNPTVVNLHLDGKVFYSAMVSEDKVSRRQNGRSLIAGA